MTQTKLVAEIRDPSNDKRRRIKCETQAAARALASSDKTRRDKLISVVGDKTLGEAAEELIADLRAAGNWGVADKVACHVRLYLDPVIGNKRLRFQTEKSIGDTARQLRVRYEGKSAGYYNAGVDTLCRILRFGFKDLTPPVSHRSQIPGLELERKAYGSRGPQFNDKPIPKGAEVSRRLSESTGGLRVLLHILLLLGLRIGEALALRRGDVVLYKGKY
ncbi:MAG: hypothetical protein WBA73_20115, partial [Devosia sp.]